MVAIGGCLVAMHENRGHRGSSCGNRSSGNDRIDLRGVDTEVLGHRRRSISEYKGLRSSRVGTLPVNRPDPAAGLCRETPTASRCFPAIHTCFQTPVIRLSRSVRTTRTAKLSFQFLPPSFQLYSCGISPQGDACARVCVCVCVCVQARVRDSVRSSMYVEKHIQKWERRLLALVVLWSRQSCKLIAGSHWTKHSGEFVTFWTFGIWWVGKDAQQVATAWVTIGRLKIARLPADFADFLLSHCDL